MLGYVDRVASHPVAEVYWLDLVAVGTGAFVVDIAVGISGAEYIAAVENVAVAFKWPKEFIVHCAKVSFLQAATRKLERETKTSYLLLLIIQSTYKMWTYTSVYKCIPVYTSIHKYTYVLN